MKAIKWYKLTWLWLGISIATKITDLIVDSSSVCYVCWFFLIMATICLVLFFVQANRESENREKEQENRE